MGEFSLCNNITIHNSTPPFNRHNITVQFESAAAGLSMTICIVFFIVLAGLPCSERLQKCYSWQSISRIASLAALVALQAATYFFSATYGFSPKDADNDVCRGQGIVYQFATSAINVEVFAVAFAAYQTIVRGVSFEKLRRRHGVWFFFTVYGVALINTVVPYLVERATDVRIFGVVDRVSGYCWMNFERNCLHIFVYFYYTLQFLTHFISLCLFIKIGLTCRRLRQHLQDHARQSIKLFIARRIVMLAIASAFFVLSFTYAILYWLGMSRANVAWDIFTAVVAFIQNSAGSLYILPFILPDVVFQAQVCCPQRKKSPSRQHYDSDEYIPSRAYRALSTPLNE
eukprot:INCI6305.3.p1 GENE.INCI6305.3~~INCI6305.3.p1  ORF type:complete len:343 (+),score=40.91 INCI6305.3:374-1402(+)